MTRRAGYGRVRPPVAKGDWTKPGVIERLGKVPDQVIATEVGVTRQRVQQLREKLGIPSRLLPLPDELVARLGAAKDVDLAREYDVEKSRVRYARQQRGIPKYVLIGPVVIPHGTRYAYTHYFCRCTPCTASNARDMSAWVAKNPDKARATRERARQKVLESAPHARGRISWYSLGCVCDGCKQAKKIYDSPAYKRKRTPSLTWSAD